MIITPNKFALLIEDMVKNKRMSYMDAVISYCSENGIDPSNTKGLINKIRLGSKVKTNNIASNIAIPVNIPK